MRRLAGFPVRALPAMAVLLLSSGAQAAPITFNTALPVSEDEVIFRQQVIVSRAADRLAGVPREVTGIRGVSVLGYGVNSKLAVFSVLPAVYRHRETGGVESDDLGLGDAEMFARYQVFREDGPGRTVRAAPFAGIRVPTGERGETGDGSVDGFGGLILTVATTGWQFDGQIRYDASTEAEGFERGDTFGADASLQYRVWPRRLTTDTAGFLFAVLEANFTHLWKDRLSGMEDPDSGGMLMFLSPGVQFAAKRWIAETAVRIPIVKDLNGAALEPDYSVIASMRFNF